jgi:hypothetical protein
MAVMLRAIGIPSRIVNGFRNGERSDITGSYLIRARDAHSWVEAFIPGRGWVEFDPTPTGDPPPKTFWSRVNLYVDAAREFWGDWVINYDFGHQNVLAELTTTNVRSTLASAWRAMDRRYWRLIGTIQSWVQRSTHPESFAVSGNTSLFVSTVAISLAAVGLWFRRRRRTRTSLAPENAASVWLQRLLKRMARKGFAKAPAQTATSWASTVHHEPLRAKLQEFVREYEKARFGTSQESAERLPALYEEIEEVLKR